MHVILSTRMVTRWPEATAMRLSSDQAMALGKEGAPKSIAGCNGLGQGRAMLWFFEERRECECESEGSNP